MGARAPYFSKTISLRREMPKPEIIPRAAKVVLWSLFSKLSSHLPAIEIVPSAQTNKAPRNCLSR
jgi:hypothetical protein